MDSDLQRGGIGPKVLQQREDPHGRHIEPSADVHSTAEIGSGSIVWHLAQVRESAVLGPNNVVGRGAYIGSGVRLGANCKIQNYALVYEPAELGDGVFVGPAAVLTNDRYPRAVTPDGRLKQGHDWTPVAVTVRDGASIGARAVCVAPVTIGRWACVAAGAVVVHDVPDHGLVAGVPARQLGWVGFSGRPLEQIGKGLWKCPDQGDLYAETANGLQVAEQGDQTDVEAQ